MSGLDRSMGHAGRQRDCEYCGRPADRRSEPDWPVCTRCLRLEGAVNRAYDDLDRGKR